MSTENTIQPTGVVNNLNVLFGGSIARPQPVTGHCQVIRIKPDLITGEVLNVGVVFTDKKRKTHFKILESAYPFKVLYGNNGMDNFGFLLSILKDHLQDQNIKHSISPHIVFGQKTFAQGESVQAILDYAYHSMVTLNAVKEEPKNTNFGMSVSNKEARAGVAKLLREASTDYYKKIYRESPIVMRNGQETITLDLPLLDENNSITNEYAAFGTIVSAVYPNPTYRRFYLNDGVTEMHNAAYWFGSKGKGNFFILRPTAGDSGFSDSILSEIDNDIDRAHWGLSKHGINVHVFNELVQICNQIQVEFH